MTGIDFVGPFTLKEKKQELKVYVIVFSCATSRGVCFTTTRTMGTSEFIARLNEFITVRSRPQEIVSDNASTFKAAAAWIKKLMQSEELHEYLEYHSIKWDFILPKSPWRGGFWERINRDLKTMLWQKLGRSYLSFDGFSRVIKDIEIVFNNRPLQYVEDEFGSRVLTPNSIIHGRTVYLLEDIKEPDNLSKMERRVRKVKAVIWERWSTQYVRSLRERHNVTKSEVYHPDIGEVVLVVSDSKNCREWKHGLVCELLKGKDQVVRGVRMIVNHRIWERPVQLVCPLEIKSQMSSEELNKRILAANKDAAKTAKLENSDERKPRKAGEMAKMKVKEAAMSEGKY